MPSVPTTSLDLSDADVVADPYPHFARERSRHEVAWHEPSGTLADVLARRGRRRAPRPAAGPDLARPRARGVPRAVQPAAPQPDDGERAAASTPGCGGRWPARSTAGHVERLRPRVQSLAAALLDEVDPDRLRRHRGVRRAAARAGHRRADRRSPAPTCPRCGAGRRRSCGCTNRRPSPEVVDAAVTAAGEFADHVREHLDRRRTEPARRPDHRPAGGRSERRRAGRGRRAPAQRRPRGVGERVRQRSGGAAPACATALPTRERTGPRDGGRGDAALRLGPPALRAHRHRSTWRSGAWSSRRASRSPRCSARPTGTPRCSPTPTTSTRRATRTRTWPSVPGLHFCLGAPLARMELAESLGRAVRERTPTCTLAGEPRSRGTFVLRGYRRVPVSGTVPGERPRADRDATDRQHDENAHQHGECDCGCRDQRQQRHRRCRRTPPGRAGRPAGRGGVEADLGGTGITAAAGRRAPRSPDPSRSRPRRPPAARATPAPRSVRPAAAPPAPTASPRKPTRSRHGPGQVRVAALPRGGA